MGEYDDLLAQLPKTNNQPPGGEYDDLLAQIPKTKPQQIKSDLSLRPVTVNGIDTGELYSETDRQIANKGLKSFTEDSVMYGKDGVAAPITTPLQQARATDSANRIFEESRIKNNQLKAAPELSDSILRVGARKGIAGIGKAEAGLVKLAGDLVGSNTLTNIADAVRQSADDYENSVVLRKSNVDGFSPDSIVQKLPNAAVSAVDSVVQMAPSLAVGGLTKMGVLPALFGQTTTQEYANNRALDQSLIPALLNASGKAGFEVAGEKLGGLDKVADAIRMATKGNGVADLGASLFSGGLKETPSELFTTAGQFGVDKMPLIGNNQDATLNDLGNQLVDTALTSMIQGGGMAAGGSVINRFAKSQQAPQPKEVPIKNLPPEPQNQSQTDLNVEGVLSALNKAKELVEAKRVAEQTTQQAEANNVTLQPNFANVGAGANEQGNIDLQGSLGANNTERTGQDKQQRMGGAAEALTNPSNDAGLVRDESSNTNDAVAELNLGTEANVKKAQVKKAPKSNTLLSKLRNIGGISFDDKLDVTGEKKAFVGGGYNQIFTKKSKNSLKGLIERGDLDDYLPYEMRLQSGFNENNDEAFDSTPAYEYLSERIARAEPVLPYEIEEELAQNRFLEDQEQKSKALHDVFDNNFDEDFINEQFQIAANDERTTDRSFEQFIAPSEASNLVSSIGNQATAEAAKPATEAENVTPQTNQGARSTVEAIAKRRAAANQLNKSKQFDIALQLAKDFLNGEQVSPIKFANAAKAFAGDAPLADAFKQLHTMAKEPAKQSKVESKNAFDAYKYLIENAKSLKELKIIGIDIQAEPLLNDAQVEALDVFFMDAQDKFEDQDTEQSDTPSLELTGESNADIQAKEKAAENSRKQEEAVARKAEVDAKVNDFALTGSNREADLAASQGAQDLFSQSKEENTSQDIKDFGEKIEGAKKDLWQGYRKAMSEELPADAKDITLAKHFPEPDYENLIASGMDIKAIAAIKAMRDMLPSKPRMAGKLRRWGAELGVVRDLSNMLIEQKLTIDELSDRLRSNQLLYKFQETIELYAELGYPAMKSAKGYRVSGGWTSYTNGIVDKGQQFALESPNSSREYFSDRESAIAKLRSKLEVAPEGTERKTKLDIYRITKTGDIVIGKKVASNKFIDLKTGFKTAREARQYYSENEVDLLKLLEQKKNVRPERRSTNDPRVGDDYRQGINVTPEKFAAEFGFRGVQFGNYVEGDRRIKDLNNAYDALLDLANLINIPPRGISLNGSLGLAFGARGKGGVNPAMAHYEPDMVVINLTKINGAGSLGHEWFHAMDNYFSRMRNKPSEFVTTNPTAPRILSGGMYVEDKSIRPELLKSFEDLMRTIRSSKMIERSKELDKTRSKDYWSTNLEMAARSFEAYLITKAKAKGYSNDYLANIIGQDGYGDDATYPYPTESEQAEINQKFDALFSEIKTKEGENGNVILYSKNDNNKNGLDKSVVKEAIKNDLYGMDIDVYQTFDDVPDYVKEQANSESGGGIEGYYDPNTNRIALIASNLPDTNRAVEVVRHELIGHYGMENMLGKDLMDKLVDQVLNAEKSNNKIIVELAQHVDKTQPSLNNKRRAKEIIAVMAERNMQNGIVKRVLDAIRKFLKRVGLINSDVTDAEIASMLRDAQAYLKNQGRSIVTGSESSFSISASTQQKYNKRIDELFNGGKANREGVTVLDKSDMLDMLGYGGKPVILAEGKVIAGQSNHQLNAEHWKKIPEWLDNPAAVFNSDTVNGRLVFIAPELLKGNPIVMIIEPNSQQDGLNVHLLVNGYDKTNGKMPVVRWINEGLLRYIDKTKSREFLVTSRLQLPRVLQEARSSSNTLLVDSDLVKYRSENLNFSRSNQTQTPLNTRGNWLFRRDELGRVQLALTGKAYDKVANVTQIVADKAMFGMASPELRKLIRHFKADMAKAMNTASEVAQEMAPMTVLDRAMVSDVVENMVKTGVTPPDHILKIAAGMQVAMDTQTDELVKLGMLSKDSAERWRGKYLPRFYNRENDPALDTFTKKLLRTALPVRGMGGGSLKGRGLYEEINVTELAQWEALGWEVRDNLWKKNQTGKLELIDSNKVRDTEKVMVWRDFTPAERESMGENRDALFRFVMGYTAMQNDIALGRMFDSIAKNQEWTRSRPSEGFTKVPDTEISETGGVKKYGNLAGLYVRDDIIQHITQYEESGELLKFYKKALSFWKMGKTVLNPVSHMNNVVSNLTMAHFAGVSYWDGHKYVGALRDFVNGSPLLDEAKDAGLMTGDITRAELLAEMPDDIKALMNMQESKITKSAKMTYNVLTFGLTKPMSKAYRFEDDFFKYLIYRDARNNGLSPDDAVDYATRYIFNYDDLPKGARVVRDAAIPFFAYTYKAMPALAHTLFNYPWRFMAPAMAISGVNMLAYALASGDDDDDLKEKLAKGKALEEEERKNLPPWLQGKSALGSNKTIRLGTDEKTGLPVYMDISRMVPGGDVFDLNNQADGVALPAPITPSNPVLTTIAAMLWNKDTFTGKEVVDINDTDKEKFKKRSGWLLKQLSPAIAPTGYHFDKLAEATAQLKGSPIETPFTDYTGYSKDGLPVQPKYALPNILGIKAKPIDLQYSADISQGQNLKEANSIKSEIRQAARLLDKKAITEREYDRRVTELEKKLEVIENKF